MNWFDSMVLMMVAGQHLCIFLFTLKEIPFLSFSHMAQLISFIQKSWKSFHFFIFYIMGFCFWIWIWIGFFFFLDFCDVVGLCDISAPPWVWTEAALVQRRGKKRDKDFSFFFGKENFFLKPRWENLKKKKKNWWTGMDLPTWRADDRWSGLWLVQQHPSWYRNSCYPSFVSSNPSLSPCRSGMSFFP